MVLQLVAAALAAPATNEDFAADEVIVVTATRSAKARGDQPVAVEVIDRELIEASGAESIDDLLRVRPGLTVDQGVTGTAISMQGLAPEHTLVLVDGQRMLGRKDGVVDLSRIAVSNIERIEIVKGPSSVMYGSDAMGGVVHIITRGPKRPEVGIHARVGSIRADGDADVSVTVGRTRHRFGVGWHAGDAWNRFPESSGSGASAFRQGNVDYRVVLDTSSDSELTADVTYQQRNLQGEDRTLTGAVLDRLQAIEDARASLSGWVTPSASTRVSGRLSAGLYRDQFLADQRGAKDLDMSSVNLERQTEGAAQVDVVAGSHAMSVGVDGLVQHLISDRLGQGDALRARGAVFLQDVWTLGSAPKLQLSPGLRYDVDTQFGDALTPRLAASLTVGEVVARLGAGTGFRAPDFRELSLLFENPGAGYVVDGADDLRPERSRNVNAGLEWAPSPGWSLSWSGFFNDVTDLITIGAVQLGPGGLQRFGYENIGRAQTAGFELGGSASPGPLDLMLSWSAIHTRDLELGLPLPGRIPHQVTGSVGVDLTQRLSIRAQGAANSRRVIYIEGEDGTRADYAPAMVTTDLRGRWRRDGVEVFAGIDNLFNTTGVRFAPIAPRMFYGGLSVRGPLTREGR